MQNEPVLYLLHWLEQIGQVTSPGKGRKRKYRRDCCRPERTLELVTMPSSPPYTHTSHPLTCTSKPLTFAPLNLKATPPLNLKATHICLLNRLLKTEQASSSAPTPPHQAAPVRAQDTHIQLPLNEASLPVISG